jgi:hypothetical protein
MASFKSGDGYAIENIASILLGLATDDSCSLSTGKMDITDALAKNSLQGLLTGD